MSEIEEIPIHNLVTIGDISIKAISHSNSYDYKKIHRHNYYEILFFTIGGGYQTIDFEKHPILDYSCYVVKPRQVHLVKKENISDGLLIQFTETMILPDVLKNSLSLLEGYYNQPIVFESDKELTHKFTDYLKEIRRLQTEKPKFYRQKSKHVLCNLLYSIEEELIKNNKIKSDSTDRIVLEFSNLIEKHLNNLSVKEYAGILNITTKKLAQIVKKQLGITPLKYIHKYLLLEIKRDLTFKELSHKEIAYNYNFDSPSNFSLFIKKQTGLTPSQLQDELVNSSK